MPKLSAPSRFFILTPAQLGVWMLIFWIPSVIAGHPGIPHIPEVEREPLDPQVLTLAPGEQKPWLSYLANSAALEKMDAKVQADELRALGQAEPIKPAFTKFFGFDPAQPSDWYATAEGRRIADIILSFQTPSGGWSKRTDMSLHVRKPGEAMGVEKEYVPTFDNDATTTQIEVLTRAYAATGEEKYKDAAIRGIVLILTAQYPNGGWPQNFPLIGGYHDYITYNDEVISDIMELLTKVADEHPHYTFVPEPLRQRAQTAIEKGVQLILTTQIKIDGKPTVWSPQYHCLELTPAAARKYEPVALSSQESANVVRTLMNIKNPSQEVIDAIEGAMAWFHETRMDGVRWQRHENASSELVKDESAPPLWSRFYEIENNRPVFGDRNGQVYSTVSEISLERQNGYHWYTIKPDWISEQYHAWQGTYKNLTTSN